MAEFCPECIKKVFDIKDNREYVLSKGLCLCEECGEWKRIVICEKKRSIQHLKIFRKKKGGY